MSETFVLDRQVFVLGQAGGCGCGPHGETKTAAGLTVALDREPGTPASEVAHEVGARLGWPVHDHELVERVARELGEPVGLLDTVDERPQSWLVECLEGFAVSSAFSEARYVGRLAGMIRGLAEAGHCVFVGRGAAQILPAGTTLRVRLVGALGDRIAAFRNKHMLSWREAACRVEEVGRAWARFVEKHFGKDPLPPHGYDLVLNSSQWSVARCADLIVDALRHREGSGACRVAAP
jgi:hypothetical protein